MSVLFADLSAFTTFSERHAATEVIAMLNDYWAAVVPGIDAAGGEIEQFVGDAVMAAFNVEGDQPDHAQRAARAALAIIDGGRASSRRIPTGRRSGSASAPVPRSWATSARAAGAASRSSATRPTRPRA